MTEEVGAITGDLELLTRLTADGTGLEVRVRYQGAQDLYTVDGGPIRLANVPDERGEREAHKSEVHSRTHDHLMRVLTRPDEVVGGSQRAARLRTR